MSRGGLDRASTSGGVTGGSTSGISGQAGFLCGTLMLPNGLLAAIEPSLATLLTDGSGRMWIAFAESAIVVSSVSGIPTPVPLPIPLPRTSSTGR